MILQEVLEEAIRLRESGQAELSLALLERAESDGLDDVWLQDNELGDLAQLAADAEKKALRLAKRDVVWTPRALRS